MPGMLPPLRLVGGKSLRDNELQERSVVIEDGRISKGPRPTVDLDGFLILPGIVNLHANSLRPTLPIDQALTQADRQSAAWGITTAWLSATWTAPLSGKSKALKIMESFAGFGPDALTDLRLQLLCDPGQSGPADPLLRAVEKFDIKHVLFTPLRDEGHELAPHVVRHLCHLAEAFDRLGVLYGTLGDASAERRERYAMIGARHCILPYSRRPAAAAFAMGDPVLIGAEQVLLNSCLQGNIPARGLIRDRLVRGLVADQNPAAMAQAALSLWRNGSMGLAQAWAMVSALPAQIMRLPDRGVIDYGKRADLVVINEQTHQIEATIAAGRLIYLNGEAANRFAAAEEPLRLAAE